MISDPSSSIAAKLVLNSIHFDITPAMSAAIERTASRLFQREPGIVRLQIDIEPAPAGHVPLFTTRGHLELAGADMLASIATDDAGKSVDLLMDKLDRMLRRRAIAMRHGPHADDLRAPIKQIG